MPKPVFICLIDYVEKSLAAERRLARGERQKQCPKCKLWWWPGELKRHKCRLQG